MKYRAWTLPRPRQAVFIAGAAVLFVAGCHRKAPTPAPAPAPTPPPRAVVDVPAGERVVRSMYDMYAGKWYRTVTFVQKTTITLATTTVVQTWYEAASLPGKLRIDVGDPALGNGTLYRGDSVYQMMGSKVSTARRDMNDLLILGFDVYAQPAATTIGILRQRGFDLTKVHETTWQGKPVYVVGALARDSTSKQFWVEKERLLFVRLRDSTAQGRSDVRFNEYVRAGTGWIAIDVEIIAARRRIKEEYSQVRANVALEPGLFNPTTWSTARHWFVK